MATDNGEKNSAGKRAAGTEPSTALSQGKVQPSKRDKGKDPDTLENDEAYGRGKTRTISIDPLRRLASLSPESALLS